MQKEKFDELAERAFESLPNGFKQRLDNVQIIVENYPLTDQLRNAHVRDKHMLLGLYEGVPISIRGTWYGSSATVPDRISLFQKNIEAVCRDDAEIEQKISEVLIHEIAHHFGMSEKEIRQAGY